MSTENRIKNIVEAALLAAGRPLSLDRLQTLFLDGEQPERDQLREALAALSADYAGRGIEVKEVASGWRIQVNSDCAPWVSRLWEEKPPRYSRALMETLALIGYRQPITRGEIEDIRGVAVSTNIVKTLLEREWVRVVGHRDVPGKPALYATTRDFLDYFGLRSLDELPTLGEIKDLESLNREFQFADEPETPGAGTPEHGTAGVPGDSLPQDDADTETQDAASDAATGTGGPPEGGAEEVTAGDEESAEAALPVSHVTH